METRRDASGSWVYRVVLEVAVAALLVRRIGRVWVERVDIDYIAASAERRTQRESIEIKQWLQPGEFRPVDFPDVARQATVRVDARAEEKRRIRQHRRRAGAGEDRRQRRQPVRRRGGGSNPMIDSKGRLWLTARIRPQANPAFCRQGSNHPSAQVFPTTNSGRQVEMWDPQTQKMTMVDLCFPTHHLQFDKKGVLWFSSGGGQSGVVGWLDVNKFDQTKDEQASQGWAPFILDTNGNGRRDAGWVEPNGRVDPAKDKRIVVGLYGVSPNPADGSVWGSVLGYPGGVARFDPATNLAEYYEVPWKNAKATPANQGFSPRGNDITTTGVVWTVLASGHLASFDRKLCNANNIKGAAIADPQNACPEGWKLYQMPGPEFEGEEGQPGASAEAPYYNWVDQHDTLGLGRDIPIATGNNGEHLAAVVNGQWFVLRVPYPMGFFAKGMDGRIDDPATGWKGKGLWSTWSTRAVQHIEGGKGNTSKVVHFQLRPDSVAK